jgi:hypothetical protein
MLPQQQMNVAMQASSNSWLMPVAEREKRRPRAESAVVLIAAALADMKEFF